MLHIEKLKVLYIHINLDEVALKVQVSTWSSSEEDVSPADF